MADIRIGIVGTGYAAKRRVEAFLADRRSPVVAVAGHRESSRELLATTYGLEAIASWQELVQRDDLDLIVVCNINREHGAIARAALAADKHVVVEYPLALAPQEAAQLISLAQERRQLLHVEHIELLGSLHQTMREYLPQLGRIFYAQYVTLAPKRQSLPHWTYHHEDYGFPFVAALSRVNRLLDLFGRVVQVAGAATYLPSPLSGYYQSCLCTGQLRFENGVNAHLVYGKGSLVQRGDRRFTIHGEGGVLEFQGDTGTFTQGETVKSIELGSRQGVFKQDTTAVLDHLTEGKPLYITAEQSLYALDIADQIRRSAETSGNPG